MVRRRSGVAGAQHRLAVLGADGFIGSAVVRAAIGQGLDTTAISVKAPWRLRQLSRDKLRHVRIADGRWWRPDLDPSLEAALQEADAVALLAYTPPPVDDAAKLEQERAVNVRGAQAIAKITASTGARVAFTSSADVYGPWHRQPVTESAAPEPGSAYAVAKLEAEEGVQRICGSATCLRIATVYGHGENGPRAIPAFIRALLRNEQPVVHGDGSDVRDYVHVDDVAAGILATLASDGPPERMYNLGSGTGRTTSSILEAIASIMARPALANHVPTERQRSRLVLDSTAIARDLAFRPRTPFEVGLREEVEWLTRHLAE